MIASYRLNFAKLVTKRERSLFLITYLDKKCNSVQQFCAIFIHYLDKLQTFFFHMKAGVSMSSVFKFQNLIRKIFSSKLRKTPRNTYTCENINMSCTITYVQPLLLLFIISTPFLYVLYWPGPNDAFVDLFILVMANRIEHRATKYDK